MIVTVLFSAAVIAPKYSPPVIVKLLSAATFAIPLKGVSPVNVTATPSSVSAAPLLKFSAYFPA